MPSAVSKAVAFALVALGFVLVGALLDRQARTGAMAPKHQMLWSGDVGWKLAAAIKLDAPWAEIERCRIEGDVDPERAIDRMAIAVTLAERRARPLWARWAEWAAYGAGRALGLEADYSLGPAQIRPSTLRRLQAEGRVDPALSPGDLGALCPALGVARAFLAARAAPLDLPPDWDLEVWSDRRINDAFGTLAAAYVGAASPDKLWGARTYAELVLGLQMALAHCGTFSIPGLEDTPHPRPSCREG